MAELDTAQIMRLLPHRYPMLMVDRIVEIDDRRIVGIKNVSINEPFFQGHFPGHPVMPGVLQLEAMAQTGGILLSLGEEMKGKRTYFLAVDKAKFRRVVAPGEQMRIEAEITNRRPHIARFRARVWVGDALASEAELTCMIRKHEAGA